MSAPYFLIDSHCHIHSEEFDEERDLVLQRAEQAGVKAMVVIGTGGQDNQQARRCAQNYTRKVFWTAGWHPSENQVDDSPEEWAQLEDLAAAESCRAVGEIGLDYHYDYVSPEDQRIRFERCLALAQQHHKPVVIHNRDSDQDMIAMLQNFPKVQGVLHCFSSSWELAQAALELGYMISFSGILTFKNADALRAMAKQVPLDQLMVETDAPYLAPVPYRGHRNEPAYVTQTLEKLAELQGQAPEDMAQQTWANTCRFFGLDNLS